MKYITKIALIIILSSCSILNNPKREISSVNDLNEIHKFQDNCSIISNQDNREFYEVSNHSVLFIDSLRKLTLVSLSNCKENEIKLSENEKVKGIKKFEDGYFINTTFGRFIVVNEEVKIHSFNFPISSFYLDVNTLNLYNSNTHGRFCTFKELEKPNPDKDKACNLIQLSLSIDNLK